MRFRPFRIGLFAALAALLTAGCRGGGDANSAPVHSSSMALSRDGGTLYVANADADSVSVIDVASRTRTGEILLEGVAPAVDGSSGNFTPAVMPRSLALAPDGRTLFVSGERSGTLYAVDTATATVADAVPVCSEPVGVVVAPDGRTVWVACSQDESVLAVDARTRAVLATIAVERKPWALALSPEGHELLVTHLLSGAMSEIDTRERVLAQTWTIPEIAPRGDRRLAHGAVRGVYDAAFRPGTDEVWVAHSLLGIDTPQPMLDFESTVFPGLSFFHRDGRFLSTLSTDAIDVAGIDGAFADVVSGPHALAFTPSGAFVLMVDANSEDLLAVDAGGRVESALLRPLPGHQPEGIVIAPDGKTAFVDERNSGDVAVVRIDGTANGIRLALDGPAIPRLAADPMPADLRLGQHLFYSANSDEVPITRNHWVACASCHMEGRSDAVTWLFEQGPRDTPTNAGGMLGTGFLFRTADRNEVEDYWRTINIEQGGTFDPNDPALASLLATLANYVNHGIPLPVPPTIDPVKAAQGDTIFHRPDVGCAGCHSGPRFTDSGSGNPTLDLAGPVVLHDVGTCVQAGDFPDVAHEDIQGDARGACAFDTPSLRGIADSAPYLHDGSAATLDDVLEMTAGQMGDVTSLSADEKDALVEYLRSL